MNELGKHQRFNDSLLAGRERRVLIALARRLPRWVMPDHLTVLGVAGAMIVFAGFALSHWSDLWLLLANVGLVVHWLGDSLDGTLARVRGIERQRYGFYLDQTVDTIGNLLIGVGLGIAPFARLDFALVVLALYHMLSIQVLVRAMVDRQFHVAVGRFGPTELRLGIFAMNLGVMLFGAPHVTTWPVVMTWCDAVLIALSAFLAGLFLAQMHRHLKRIGSEDPAAGRIAPPR